MSEEIIRISTARLQKYIESENYRGYDPYDALTSPLFNLPFFKTNKTVRFYFQQAIKRSPVNLRPLLGISKGLNPVTLGLCLQGYTQQIKMHGADSEGNTKCTNLLEKLITLKSAGFPRSCWGYDFDWEARYARIPALQPTVVATGIISNALFDYYKVSNNSLAFELCKGSAEFVMEDLQRSTFPEGICFSYSPFDTQCVLNANMKGVRILSQVYSVTGEEKLAGIAKQAVNFVLSHQQEDGSWPYSLSAGGEWIDNYHTGYILDCLDEYRVHTGDATVKQPLEKGWTYYRRNFFEEESIPKFYNKETYPVDCTAAAQSLLTLCRFGDIALATRVAVWMSKHMQREDGSFYFRRFKNRTMKTSFMRWSNAWMFAGLSELQRRLNF